MIEIEVIARKWGDSIAVIIPRRIADAQKITPKSRVKLRLQKEDDLSDLFGKFEAKKTPQELKDESRKDWE